MTRYNAIDRTTATLCGHGHESRNAAVFCAGGEILSDVGPVVAVVAVYCDSCGFTTSGPLAWVDGAGLYLCARCASLAERHACEGCDRSEPAVDWSSRATMHLCPTCDAAPDEDEDAGEIPQ